MKQNKVFSAAFIKICFINFAMMAGQTMANTLVPRYADVLGAPSVIVGMIAGAFSLSSLLCKPFCSPAIDTFSRKRLLLATIIVAICAFLGLSVSSSVWMVFAFRLLHGVGIGCSVILCLTMVSDVLPETHFTSGIAYYSIANAIAQAIGPGLGLTIQEHAGYQAAFFAGALLMSLAAAAALGLKERNTVSKKPYRISPDSIYAKEALIPAIILFFLAAVYINISSFLSLYADELHVEGIGLFFTVNALILLFSRPLVGKLSDRFGAVKILPVTIVCFGLSVILIGFSSSLAMFLLAAVLNGFGYGACQPIIQSLCMKSVPADRRGSASATSYYGSDLGYLIGPVIAGMIADKAGYAVMFRTIPLILLAALSVLIIFRRTLIKIDLK